MVSGGRVHAGGYCKDSQDVKMAGYWLDGHWKSLPGLSAGHDSEVYSLRLAGGDLYAAGYSRNALNVAVPGYWKNGNWMGLAALDAAKDAWAITSADQ
jgi:hypothetical protein